MCRFNYAARTDRTVLTELILNENEVSLESQRLVFMFLKSAGAVFPFSAVSQSIPCPQL